MSTEDADNFEIEVKFYIVNLAVIRERLIALGAKQIRPRVYEKNVVYDTADQWYRQNRRLIRLRHDEDVRLTFKGDPPAAIQAGSEAKIREEIEVTVNDFDKMDAILKRMRLAPTIVYEKYRETWQFHDVEVVLDELPYGDFVELEGSENGIKSAAAALSLEWTQRLTTNYLALMAKLVAHHQLAISDLTFDNFRGRDISVGDILG